MASLSVSADVKKAKKKLNRIQKKQIPFALSNAINDVAFHARGSVEPAAMKQYLDRPTRFTTNSFHVKKSTKKTLVGRILIMPNRWNYLKYVVLGGASTRPGKDHAIAIDHSLLNRYGGLPRNKAKRLVKQKGHFSLTGRDGNDYIFRRNAPRNKAKAGEDNIEARVVFKKTTTQTKLYPIWQATIKSVRSRFPSTFDRRLKFSLKTAR